MTDLLYQLKLVHEIVIAPFSISTPQDATNSTEHNKNQINLSYTHVYNIYFYIKQLLHHSRYHSQQPTGRFKFQLPTIYEKVLTQVHSSQQNNQMKPNIKLYIYLSTSTFQFINSPTSTKAYTNKKRNTQRMCIQINNILAFSKNQSEATSQVIPSITWIRKPSPTNHNST